MAEKQTSKLMRIDAENLAKLNRIYRKFPVPVNRTRILNMAVKLGLCLVIKNYFGKK